MKKVITIFIFSAFLYSDNYEMQEPELFAKGGFGFTVGSSSGNILTSLLASTINIVSPTYYAVIPTKEGKIEPSIGYFGMSEGENSINMTSLGLGLLKNYYSNENIKSYAGIRGVYMIIAATDQDSESIMSLSAVTGAEYYFNNNFSIGGETRFTYLKPNDDSDMSMRNLDSVLFFRFYLKH